MSEVKESDKGIIYNVTIKVDKGIATAWLAWLLEEHIPAIIATGCFHSYKVVRLLETDDAEGPTYAIQYFATDLAEYTRYIREHAPAFRQDSTNKWGNAFIAFRSVMEVIA
ncbi:MAG: hypothetical protein JWP69_447 [Flaviaesturariibacter sp.]|nr:hypothetical protein [Flaviaesturariibacter sp.]